MPMMSPARMAPATAAMAIAMMVAMMLPSVAPALWRYHRHLRGADVPRAALRTALFAAAYASVWTAISLTMFAARARLSPSELAPWAGAAILCAGLVQRSRWKADRLHLCREPCAAAGTDAKTLMPAWRHGLRFGLNCGVSCAAPMAGLFVGGLMDPRLMIAITAAITAERVAPDGAHISRFTGGLAIAAGLVMCARVITQ